MRRSIVFVFAILFVVTQLTGCALQAKDIIRPEQVVSKRIKVYDTETYNQLALQWKAYNDQFPSEFAYANWMYAARYAGWDNYEPLLDAGVNKYPANPTMLYLKSMTGYGKSESPETRRYLEKAVELDPGYSDPWFSLVTVYMCAGEWQQVDVALRRLLESGVVQDVVMDYNYNVLLSLEKNAILVTNGDNDTYPVWILQRILNIRPDVTVVNRSLLNTDWYALQLIDQGRIPRFITADELAEMRKGKGPYDTMLIEKLLPSAKKNQQPLYFALTLYMNEPLEKLAADGFTVGLAHAVAPVDGRKNLVRKTSATWLSEFRTGGLDSWKVRYADQFQAEWMGMNYSAALLRTMEEIKTSAPDKAGPLFQWYLSYCLPLQSPEMQDKFGQQWSRYDQVPDIRIWCREQGYSE